MKDGVTLNKETLLWIALTGGDIALFGGRGNLKIRQHFFAAVTVQEIGLIQVKEEGWTGFSEG